MMSKSRDATFGQQLQSFRARSEFTQTQLARAAGLSAVTVYKLEHDQARPRPDTVDCVVAALKLTDDERNNLRMSLINVSDSTPQLKDAIRQISRIAMNDATKGEAKKQLATNLLAAVRTWKVIQRNTVRWAIIPAAGWQSRAVGPERLRHMVDIAIGEARQSGIKRIVVVAARGLEATIVRSANAHEAIVVETQEAELGTAHALMCGDRHWDSTDPVVMIMPDKAVANDCLVEMVRLYDAQKSTVIAVRRRQADDEKHYGMVSFAGLRAKPLRVTQVKEKPGRVGRQAAATALGRYVLAPEVLAVIRQWSRGGRLDYYAFTRALDAVAQDWPVFGYFHKGRVESITPSGRRFDDELNRFLRRAEDLRHS